MEPFENAGNLSEDVGLFEAATHSTVVELPVPDLKSITLVLDGSDQDETARGFAEALAAQTGAAIASHSGSAGAPEILATVREQGSSLLVLPVPCGQNYHELKSESLGSVADQLLLHCPCPMLCIRACQDADSIQSSLANVLVPMAVADDSVLRALGWAFRVTSPEGRVDLVAVADREVMEEARHLMSEQVGFQALESDQIARAMMRDIGSLVAAAQKRGLETGHDVHLETRVGGFVPLVLAERHDRPSLIISGITRDHASPAFHRAADLLLASHDPVLLV